MRCRGWGTFLYACLPLTKSTDDFQGCFRLFPVLLRWKPAWGVQMLLISQQWVAWHASLLAKKITRPLMLKFAVAFLPNFPCHPQNHQNVCHLQHFPSYFFGPCCYFFYNITSSCSFKTSSKVLPVPFTRWKVSLLPEITLKTPVTTHTTWHGLLIFQS